VTNCKCGCTTNRSKPARTGLKKHVVFQYNRLGAERLLTQTSFSLGCQACAQRRPSGKEAYPSGKEAYPSVHCLRQTGAQGCGLSVIVGTNCARTKPSPLGQEEGGHGQLLKRRQPSSKETTAFTAAVDSSKARALPRWQTPARSVCVFIIGRCV
jgi:hypothetical protein